MEGGSMSGKKTWSWIPVGIMAALILSLAVAWAFRDRGARVEFCTPLYAAALTAEDSARVDSTVVPVTRVDAPITCGEVMGR